MTADKPLCVSQTRSGGPCRRPAVEYGQCRQHVRQGIPQPPAGLSDAAETLWWAVMEELDPDKHDESILREAVRALSRCDALADVIDAEGMTTAGSKGQVVVHPALAEARQQELVVARLIAQLRLPERLKDEGEGKTSSEEARPQRRGGARGIYLVGGAS